MVIVPLVKRNDVSVNRFQYYDTTTQKEGTIKFYSCYDHLENFGFTWEYKPLKFVYKASLSADEKALRKKLIIKRCARHAVTVDDSRLNICNDRYQVISVSSEWVKKISHFLTSSGQI